MFFIFFYYIFFYSSFFVDLFRKEDRERRDSTNTFII